MRCRELGGVEERLKLWRGQEMAQIGRDRTHIFFVVMKDFTELLAGNFCSMKDLIVRALAVEVLVDTIKTVNKRARPSTRTGSLLTD